MAVTSETLDPKTNCLQLMESSQDMNYEVQMEYFPSFQHLVSPCSSTVFPVKWGQ